MILARIRTTQRQDADDALSLEWQGVFVKAAV